MSIMKIKLPTLRFSVIAFAICQIYASNAWAAKGEAERIAELEKKLEKSLQQIEKLSNRLAELEKISKPASTTVPVATPVNTPDTATAQSIAAQSQRIESIEQNLTQISEAANRPPTNLGVPLHGFADVGYAHSTKSASDGRKRGFVLGNVDFYLTPEFGDRVKSLIELNFEYGEAGSLATDLERV